MKRCPECRRDYYDDSLFYCLDDGNALLEGPRSDPPAAVRGFTPSDDPATAILYGHGDQPSGNSPSESTTPAPVNKTDKTAIFQLQSEAETREALDGISEGRDLREHRRVERQDKHERHIGLFLTSAIAVLIIVLGFFGYRYFFATNAKQIESIAVLPFVNDSGNVDNEYLSDGMTETLISSLSQLPNLNIKPRSLVFRYKGKDANPDAIGRELNVQAVLTGRVASRGGDLSLFAELIDVASTKVIWSRQYNRKQADIILLQSEIARDVSSRLKSSLSEADEKRLTKQSTDNPEAYRLYLLGNSLAARRKTKDLRVALEYYQQAIALDSNYALAYTGLASAQTSMVLYGGLSGNGELPKARAAASRAIDIDPSLAEAHNALGGVELFLNRDFGASEKEIIHALELNPNLANAYRYNGLRLAYAGRFDEAIAAFRRSLELEPMALATNTNLAWCLFYAGRIPESDAQIKVAQQIDPTFWFVEYVLFVNARAKRDYAAAVEFLARTQELRDEPDAAKFIRETFKESGWNGFMRAAIAEPERSKIWDYYLATFAAESGDKEKAFAFLNRALEKYDQFILFIKIDPLMNPLRDEPRYNDILRKLGFPQ